MRKNNSTLIILFIIFIVIVVSLFFVNKWLINEITTESNEQKIIKPVNTVNTVNSQQKVIDKVNSQGDKSPDKKTSNMEKDLMEKPEPIYEAPLDNVILMQ